MNRIERIFSKLRAEGRKGLMPFVTAGFPSLATTQAVLPALEAGGASICELGIPFSDPIADGPVIAASMTQALKGGVTPAGVFEMVRRVRPHVGLGLVAMVSYSIVYRMGVERFVKQAAEAGFDGFIFPDLPLEEADAVAAPVREAGMTSSLLIAPTTPGERVEKIVAASSGFVYVVSLLGITGERERLPEDLADRLSRIRRMTDLPIAVGFGISKPQHVRVVTELADAAIVGSALVRSLAEHGDEPLEQQAEHARRFVEQLAAGLTPIHEQRT